VLINIQAHFGPVICVELAGCSVFALSAAAYVQKSVVRHELPATASTEVKFRPEQSCSCTVFHYLPRLELIFRVSGFLGASGSTIAWSLGCSNISQKKRTSLPAWAGFSERIFLFGSQATVAATMTRT
jgi:hypothetical protein